MSDHIIYIDKSAVREGKLAELKLAIADLVKFVETHEPRIASYGVYLNEDEATMTVVHIHPDQESLAYHMEVAGPAFAKFVDLIELSSIEVYGRLDAELLERLRNKARMLGSGVVRAHDLHEGFARLQSVKATGALT